MRNQTRKTVYSIICESMIGTRKCRFLKDRSLFAEK